MPELNEAFFALPALHKFPIHTKRDTLASFGAYRMTRDKYDKDQKDIIEHNFNKAAAYYDISLETPEPMLEKRSSLLLKGANQNFRITEITNKEELNASVDFILEKRASTPREDLAEVAKYILWSAANSSTDMNTPKMRKIAHIAGIGIGDREKIQNELHKRATEHVMSDEVHDKLWDYIKEVKNLSDEDFFKEANLNSICNVCDSVDFMRNEQDRHATTLGYPEDVIFENTMGDLLKEASDLYYIPSIDTTLSKKATLERTDAINAFFKTYFSNYKPLSDDSLIAKMASLDPTTAKALIEAIE